MAYKAYLNETELFFDSSLHDDSFLLSAARLEMQAGAAGSFTFTIPPTNEYYDDFHRLTDYVDVFRDDERIFSGRVYSIKKIFDTQYQIVCEGLLAVLNDTIFRPITFDGTLYALVNEIISNHNSQVEEAKGLFVESITVPDANVYRDYLNHETSISRLQDLGNSFGGYMMLEKDYNEDYIAIADIAIADLAIADKETGALLKFSWLEDFTTGCDQKIELASNLIDIQRELNSDDVITVLIPLGVEDDEGNRLTIESVNGGLDYLTASSEYINQYGYVTGIHEWDDVTTAAALKTKGHAWLSACLTPKTIINLTAVDLADAGYDVESFRIGQKVTVYSVPHDLDNQQFNCTTQTLDLLHPEQNRLTLGETQISYTTAQRASSPAAMIQKMSQTFVSKSALQQAVDQATNRIVGNDGGYVVIHDANGDGEPDEILVMDTPDITTAVKVWRWNKSGLGYSNNGYYGTFGLAMTIDGQIVADYITTGSMSAERITTGTMSAARIKAGVLQSEDANAYWNLDTGYLSITKGQINIATSSDSDDKIKLAYGTKTTSLMPKGLICEDTNYGSRAEYYSAINFKYNSTSLAYFGLAGSAGSPLASTLRLSDSSGNTSVYMLGTDGSIDVRKYKIKGTDIKDYVIGETTYNDTTNQVYFFCRRWNSGYTELFGTRAFTANITTAWGNLYEGRLGYITFPITFQEVPKTVYSIQSCSAGCWIEHTGTTDMTTTETLYACRPTSQSGVAVTVAVYAIGKEVRT